MIPSEELKEDKSDHHGHHHCASERCDKCDSELKHTIYCTACEKIQQYNKTMNYFSIFGVSPGYDIDKKEVTAAFERLIFALHPDMYVNGSKEDQALSLSHTALLYEAKETLFYPFKRGRYLLSLLMPGFDGMIPQPPQAFVLEMFEIQEELDLVQEGSGSLKQTEARINLLLQEIDEALSADFKAYIPNREDKMTAGKILSNLAKLKFLDNLGERIRMIGKNLRDNLN
ncbi:MAG: hypothetical protein OEY59_00910 [Deltaproteobacteria bacterium]|nr:hypothetical protein [Deltaproteobacteria bacterium]